MMNDDLHQLREDIATIKNTLSDEPPFDSFQIKTQIGLAILCIFYGFFFIFLKSLIPPNTNYIIIFAPLLLYAVVCLLLPLIKAKGSTSSNKASLQENKSVVIVGSIIVIGLILIRTWSESMGMNSKELSSIISVSYTHLTLPTILRV